MLPDEVFFFPPRCSNYGQRLLSLLRLILKWVFIWLYWTWTTKRRKPCNGFLPCVDGNGIVKWFGLRTVLIPLLKTTLLCFPFIFDRKLCVVQFLPTICKDAVVGQGNTSAQSCTLPQNETSTPSRVSHSDSIEQAGQICEENEERGFCFCTPCVTLNRQSWLRHGQPAHVGNSGIRKRIYWKFWSMLNRREA